MIYLNEGWYIWFATVNDMNQAIWGQSTVKGRQESRRTVYIHRPAIVIAQCEIGLGGHQIVLLHEGIPISESIAGLVQLLIAEVWKPRG